jgi:hypothetical protein
MTTSRCPAASSIGAGEAGVAALAHHDDDVGGVHGGVVRVGGLRVGERRHGVGPARGELRGARSRERCGVAALEERREQTVRNGPAAGPQQDMERFHSVAARVHTTV